MTLDPLLSAPLAVQIHMLAALPALLIGPFVLYRARRDRLHRRLGHAWVASMVVLAVSGLFIASQIPLVWHFGPIHILSVYALLGLADGIRQIRRGDVRGHRRAMRSVWYGAMVIAGLLTLLPGRTVNRMVFGGPSDLGWLVVPGLAALLWVLWRRAGARQAL